MSIIKYRTPELTAWSPFNRLTSVRDLLDSAFQLASTPPEGWVPPLEILEDGEKITVRLELPGMKKEDFDISLHEEVLTVSGERRSETEGKEGESFRSERFFGTFSRSVTLPAAVKTDEVKAGYQDGILAITLPKAEEAKPKKIQINLS